VVRLANAGTSHTKEKGVSQAFRVGAREGRFHATTNPVEAYDNSPVKLIAVPVGTRGRNPDLSSLVNSVGVVSRHLRPSDSVIVTPTVPVGTNREKLVPLIESNSSLSVDKDFAYVYNPERITGGQAIDDFEENYPLIVSGAGPRSIDFGLKFYSGLSRKGVMMMSSMEAAESEKTFEGIYRDVNIALANELAKFCEVSGLDFWEIREAANSQPYSHLHKPGLGVGGFCIPVYPYFFLHAAEKHGLKPNLTRQGRITNQEMPAYCVQRVVDRYTRNLSNLKGRKVALLGLAFRGDVPDRRLSPTYGVIHEFSKYAPKLYVHDPLIISDDDLPRHVTLSNDLGVVLNGADIVMVCTDHKQYRTLSPSRIFHLTKRDSFVFDGRGVLDRSRFEGHSIMTVGVGATIRGETARARYQGSM